MCSAPRSSSLRNSVFFLEFGPLFWAFFALYAVLDANSRETWHFLIGRLIISLSFSFFSLFHTAFTLFSRAKWGLRTVECSGTPQYARAVLAGELRSIPSQIMAIVASAAMRV